MEIIRDGIDDYDYLAILERLTAGAKDSNRKAAAQKVLERVRAEFPSKKRSIDPPGNKGFNDLLKLAGLRDAVADAIESLYVAD